MSDLLERLKKATGPNLQLDADIDMHFGLTPEPMSGYAEKKRLADGTVWMLPHYTSSTDAALALAERVLPGWKWQFYSTGMYGASSPCAGVAEPDFAEKSKRNESYLRFMSEGNTPSIAICIAVLKAHEATHDR